jgi:hypothetical protein
LTLPSSTATARHPARDRVDLHRRRARLRRHLGAAARREPDPAREAIQHYGRIFKSLHILALIDDGGYRRATPWIRNLQKRRHALGRKVFHGSKGELDQRYREGMKDQLGALGLVLNCVGLWNTVYINAALEHLRATGSPVLDDEVVRLHPFMRRPSPSKATTFLLPALDGQLRELRDPTEHQPEDDDRAKAAIGSASRPTVSTRTTKSRTSSAYANTVAGRSHDARRSRTPPPTSASAARRSSECSMMLTGASSPCSSSWAVDRLCRQGSEELLRRMRERTVSLVSRQEPWLNGTGATTELLPPLPPGSPHRSQSGDPSGSAPASHAAGPRASRWGAPPPSEARQAPASHRRVHAGIGAPQGSPIGVRRGSAHDAKMLSFFR